MTDTAADKTASDKTGSDPRAPGRRVPLFQSNSDNEDAVDMAGEDSFPASDPPSNTPVSHAGKPCAEKP